MKESKKIFVNQIGYRIEAVKIAYAAGFSGGEDFYVKNLKNETVFTGKLSVPVEDRVAAEPICKLDFSELKTEGSYFLCIDDVKSFEFKIGNSIFTDLYFSTLDYFRLSRCGEKIEGGEWSHDPCHTGIAEVYGAPNITLNVKGGWHDAGDYGRYIVAGAKTVMDLLLAYEVSSEKFSKFDILKEVRFELEWMLQMQRPDGAVYHKISCYHFCAFISPEQETDKIVLAPVSTAATADFAGCLAYAAKFYDKTDKEFSKTLISAAKKAQKYLSSHEDELYKNPSEITTGGYGDWNVNDERYFALCSLFAATGDKTYLDEAKAIREKCLAMPENSDEPWKRNWSESFGWGSVAGYGTEILLKKEDKIEDKDFVNQLKNAVIAAADSSLNISNNASFGTAAEKFFWGSNGHVCDLAHMMLLAYSLTNKKDYFDAAQKQVDYILGCNPLNICYVTGNGSNAVKNPHHRPSGAVGKAMPGMLSGGVCEGLNDQVAKEHLENAKPLCRFIDMQGSYSTNEVAIYWNSPLVLVLANLL